MARRSERVSSGASFVANSGHKRAGSDTTSSKAQAKRSKLKNGTPTRSKYFDRTDASEDDSDQKDASESSASVAGDDDSDFGTEGQESTASEAEDESDYGGDSDENPKAKGRRKVTPAKNMTLKVTPPTHNAEAWRPGVKAGLGPGTQLVIKKVKPRPAGKTPYQDETLHPNTLLFLKDLKHNNDRQWLKMHDAEFRQAENDWKSFVEKLTEKLAEIDDTVPELPVKDVIFRIYRDIRFSPDPTPYKAHFSVAWSRTGRKGPYAHYYCQISPDGESFVGGGLWHPEAAPVAAMRSNIDSSPRNIKDVLMDDRIRKEFLSGAPKKDSKVVSAFISNNSENALKTKPKGYDADHADIALLRLRNYTIGRKLTEEEVVGRRGLDRIVELLGAMKPFITYLNSVVMPDEAPNEDEPDSSEPSDDANNTGTDD